MPPRVVTVDVVCEEIGDRVWQVRCGQCPPPGIVGVAFYGQDQAAGIADVHVFGHAVQRGEVRVKSAVDRARWLMFKAQQRANKARGARAPSC